MEKKIVRKRKSHERLDSFEHEIVENPTKIQVPCHQNLLRFNSNDVDELNLSLSPSSFTVATTVVNPSPPPSQLPPDNNADTSSGRGRRSRLKSDGGRAIIKTNAVTPPFRWATDRRATVHSMEYLVSKGINTITGDVQCRKCERIFEVGYNLREKFHELVYLILYEEDMNHRAPEEWMEPVLPTCKLCGEKNSCKPLIAEKKRSINWLFLLLGQLLGCCTLEQLKYFCKHTENHRTGAKDRVLFLTYFTLCKQLDPNGPFNF
ncbi:uncharacterized protein LOC141646472 [Silene latifolia]|uniref:uncharacterized protein LOC141646472 n=1 Tax=Silene latifolia TaxID=37657 RepID=UPI003D7713B6